MCTPNLHALVCRGSAQEAACGPLSLNTELWVERGIKEMKAITAGKVTREPERIIAKELSLRFALNNAAALHGIRPVALWRPAVR